MRTVRKCYRDVTSLKDYVDACRHHPSLQIHWYPHPCRRLMRRTADRRRKHENHFDDVCWVWEAAHHRIFSSLRRRNCAFGVSHHAIIVVTYVEIIFFFRLESLNSKYRITHRFLWITKFLPCGAAGLHLIPAVTSPYFESVWSWKQRETTIVWCV